MANTLPLADEIPAIPSGDPLGLKGDLSRLHSLQENVAGLASGHFNHNKSGLVLFTVVSFESRPVSGTRDKFLDSAQESTTVTGTKGKGVVSFKEVSELFSGQVVEQNRLGPTSTSSQNITVRETTAGSKSNKVLQRNSSTKNIGHVNIVDFKAGLLERPSHFSLRVHTLFSQNGNLRFLRVGNRVAQVVSNVVRHLVRDTRVGVVAYSVVLLFGGNWIVSQLLDVVRGVGPGLLQLSSCVLIHLLTVKFDGDGLFLSWFTNDRNKFSWNAVGFENLDKVVVFRRIDLENGT